MRLQRLKKEDIPARLNPNPPQHISKLLFIEAQEGWGDFLYALGLVRQLNQASISIDVVSLPETYSRYKPFGFINCVYSLGSKEDIASILRKSYDAALDISYVNSIHWDLRYPLLKELKCHKITIGDLVSHLNIFDSFIDVSSKGHWIKRNAIIYNELTNNFIDEILPYYNTEKPTDKAIEFLKKFDNQSKILYLNTKARFPDRSLSESQVRALIDLFNERKISRAIVHTDFPFTESRWVKKLPKMVFSDFVYIVQQCQAIISPDTSAIHLGSALGLPVAGIYSGNNRDYWPQYSMQEVWSPLTDQSELYVEDDNAPYSSDFIYKHPRKDLNRYNPNKIKLFVADFLNNIAL